MKTMIAVTLALFGSLSVSAQVGGDILPCPFFGEELQKVLLVNRDQCQRISTIHSESWKTIEPLDKQLGQIIAQITNLSWTEDIPAEEAARKIGEVIVERRKLLDVIRQLDADKNRKVLEVLDKRQRGIVSDLIGAAGVVRLFNQATGAGLIPYNLTAQVGGAIGSAEGRIRP